MNTKVNVWKFDVEKLIAIRQSPVDSSRKECLIKFKNLSHRRLVWKDESKVKLDNTGSYYLKRYRSQICDKNAEAVNFCSPNYFMVERIVAVRTDDWDCSDESDVESASSANKIVKKKTADISDSVGEDYVTKASLPVLNLDEYENTWEDCTTIQVEDSNAASSTAELAIVDNLLVDADIILHSDESLDRIKKLYERYSGTKVTRYLVKWRGLGYSYCTWEKEEVILSDYLPVHYYDNIRLSNSQLLHRYRTMHASICQLTCLQGEPNTTGKPLVLLTENYQPSSVHIEGPYCFRIEYISAYMMNVTPKTSSFIANDSLLHGEHSTVKYTNKKRKIIIHESKSMDMYYSNCKQHLFSLLQKQDVELVQQGKVDKSVHKDCIIVPIDAVATDDCVGIELKDYQLQGVKWLCK